MVDEPFDDEMPWMIDTTECFLNEFDNYNKENDDLVKRVNNCIAAFEEKRTAKWQAIFDKMKN